MHFNYPSIQLKRRKGPVPEDQNLEVQDVSILLRYMDDCNNDKKILKSPYVKFVNYLEITDYKKLNFTTLNQQQVLFIMRILNNWISEILLNTQKNQELPSYIYILATFYQYMFSAVKVNYNNQKMNIASAFFFNNLATFFLRSKQYKQSLKYFLKAIKNHDRDPIPNPVFSISYANLSILSYLLDQPSKAEKYLQRGIKNSKVIHKQYLDGSQIKLAGFTENLNILINMYISLIDLYERRNEVKSKINELEKICIELINQNSKITNKKNWFIKYFYEKKKKNRYDSAFETLFNVNVQQLKLFSTQLITPQILKRKETPKPPSNIHEKKAKIVFKKFIFELCFYEEGIIIKVPFSLMEQRLDWDMLKSVISNLELTQLEENQIQVNCTQHLIANILINHIEITETIRIKKKKLFDFSFRTDKFEYNFLYIGNKEFYVSLSKLNDQQSKQKKRFFICLLENLERYFNIIKEDEYKLSLKKKIFKEQVDENIFQLDSIKQKNDINSPKFEEEIKPLVLELENSLESIYNSFLKVVLVYEENEGLIGSLFDLRQDNSEQQLIIKAKNLKKYNCNIINTEEIQKNISLKYVEDEFGIIISQLNEYENFWIKNFLVSLFELKTHFIGGQIIDYRNSQRTNDMVFYMEKRTIQNGCFIQKFLEKKYYRPITISVVGIKKKCFGIRMSFYNQIYVIQDRLFILCSEDWFQLKKQQKAKLLKHNSSILSYHALCGFIQKIDLTQTFQKLMRLKKQTKQNILSIEQFLESAVYNT